MDLVVVHRDKQEQQVMQQQVAALELLLRKVMHDRHAATCSEIADLDRYRLVTQYEKVLEQLQKERIHQPFVFLINLN